MDTKKLKNYNPDVSASPHQNLMEFDVPDDGTCLFYCVMFSVLLPVVKDIQAFTATFLHLFGEEVVGAVEEIRQLLLRYDGSGNFIKVNAAQLEVLADINLRKRIVNFLRSHKKEFEGFYDEGEGFEARLKKVEQPKIWGDETEIQAMSAFLNRKIIVWQGGKILRQYGEQYQQSSPIHLVFVAASGCKGDAKNHYHFKLEDQPIFMEQLDQLFRRLSLNQDDLPDISIQEFERLIQYVIALTRKGITQSSVFSEIKNKFFKIMQYFEQPKKVKGAALVGGMFEIRKKYEAALIHIQLAIKNQKLMIIPEPEKFISGMYTFAQRIKVENAYRDILKGKKFIKAGVTSARYKNTNPVQEISKENIKKLIVDLKAGGGNKHFGLRPDEIELFGALLDLPYKLQHATNAYYPIVNSGSLDSYTEIHRHNPDYESPFSTKGNIDKLGNGGFVFFRVFVDGVNNSQTRYGDTAVTLDMNLLRKCGWISLHDQLVPFSTPGAEHFYWGKRLLRKAVTVGINNTTTDKTLNDGICYEYRKGRIMTYQKYPKDTLKSLGDKIKSKSRNFSFTEEIFYGEDILLGISLSIIRELRFLEECDFRKHILTEFLQSDMARRQTLLGELVKGLFRIEGKYPVALRLNLTPSPSIPEPSQKQSAVNLGILPTHPTYTPIAKSDYFHPSENHAFVNNPDGDKRYTLDMKVNEASMDLAKLEEEQKKRLEKISIARRLRAKFKKNNNAQSEKEWTEKLNTLLNEVEDAEERYQLAKRLVSIPVQVSQYVYQSEDLYDLLLEEAIPFEEFAQCSEKGAKILSKYDIRKPIEERGYTISELLALYTESPWHLEALTCDDLTELVLDIAPDVNDIVMEYAHEEDVDIEWVIEQLCESDQATFRLNLGYDDSPHSDGGEYSEEYDGYEEEYYEGDEEPIYSEYSEGEVETPPNETEYDEFWGEVTVLSPKNKGGDDLKSQKNQTQAWKIEFSYANSNYTEGKQAFRTKDFPNAMLFFQLAKDRYENVLADDSIDVKSREKVVNRLKKMEDNSGGAPGIYSKSNCK